MHADPRTFDAPQPSSVLDLSRLHPGVVDSLAYAAMRKLTFLKRVNPNPWPGSNDDVKGRDCLRVLAACEPFLAANRLAEMHAKLASTPSRGWEQRT